MDNLQDRLQLYLNYLNIPMQKFERQCGIGQGLGVKLSLKSYATTFKRISDAYPELNIDWLKTGEGEMLKSKSMMQENISGTAVQGNGRDFSQTTYSISEEVFGNFTEGIKNQNKLTEKALNQNDKTIELLSKAIDMQSKALEETAKQREQTNRLIDLLEKTITK